MHLHVDTANHKAAPIDARGASAARAAGGGPRGAAGPAEAGRSVGQRQAADEPCPRLVDHDQRREQIAHAACQVVAKHGFEQATVARIARAAGYTTGMVRALFHVQAGHHPRGAAAEPAPHRSAPERGGSQRADLLAVLTEALPIDASRFTECAFWTAFWGQVSDGPRREAAQRLGAPRIREAVPKCIATHWPQSAHWPPALRAQVLLVDHDVHQWADGERRDEPRRLAGRAAGGAAGPAAADAAALGGTRRRRARALHSGSSRATRSFATTLTADATPWISHSPTNSS